MNERDSLLNAIEADPTDDALWLVFADWLEERGEPFSEVLRRTIELRAWQEGFDEVSRRLGFRELQLMACDAVERLLPVFERQYPDNPLPRRLVETLRLGSGETGLRALNKEVVRSLWVVFGSVERNTHSGWLTRSAAECVNHLLGWPRQACVQAADALGHQRVGVIPSRRLAKKKAEALRAAIEIEFRRLIADSIRRYLACGGAEGALHP